MLRQFNDQNFQREVLDQDVPTLVLFTAPWAGPCNLARPVMEELAQRYGNMLSFGEFVLDDNPATPERCGVRMVPVFYLFEDGEPVDVVAGALDKDRLFKMIEDLV